MLKYILALLLVVGVVLPLDRIKAYEISDCRPCSNKYLLLSAKAVEQNSPPFFIPIKEFFQNTSLELRIGGFYPLKKKPRRIYKEVWGSIGLEATKTLCKNLQAWLGFDYIFSNGQSTVLKKKSNFNLLPLSLGVSYLQPITCNTIAYLGIGGTYSFLLLRNHSRFFRKRVNESAFGGIAKTGLYFCLWDSVYADLFVNYFYHYFTFSKHKSSNGGFLERNNVNLSGINLGLGLNVTF